MSREQGHDAFRRLRTEMCNSQRPSFGVNTRTVSSSKYQDTNQRSVQGNLDIFSRTSNRTIRDAANMPIFLEDTQSNILNRDFNKGRDSVSQPSNMELHNIPVSAALEALQSYGPVLQSPSRLPMQKDRKIGYIKNINNPSEKFPAFLSSILKSKDSNLHSAESPTVSTSDISCPPFSDLNLNNVDEEDEYLYGDSNSLPEMPQLLKNTDQSNVKTNPPHRPGWSDDEDLFDESSNTSPSKLNVDQMNNSNVWSLRNKNIQLKLTQKLEGNTNDSSRNIPHDTFSVEQQSSFSSAEFQSGRHLPNKIIEKDEKNIVPGNNSNVTSTSAVKSKYHVAAQVLKKKITEKLNPFANESKDFSSNDLLDMKNNSLLESFKKDIPENKLGAKSNILIKDSKQSKMSTRENVKKLPKAFLQRDIDSSSADLIGKPQRKQPSSREAEYVKQPRQENYRNLSPDRYHSPYQSRCRSPVDEYRHHSPYHSRQRSPGSDSRHRISSYDSKDKSPHRNYDRHSYDYNARHKEGFWHHSRSPTRKSTEHSARYNKYRARSPGSLRSKERSRSPGSFRCKERSRSPGSFRSKERSRSPGSFRSKERSRSPGYRRSGDRSHEHDHKKDSYKLRKLSRDSESRKRKRDQDYSSDDSFCSLSLGSESDSSDSSHDTQGKKEKSSARPVKKEKKTDNTKSSKTDSIKVEKIALEDVCVKKADMPSLHDSTSPNLTDICNFQDKTSGDTDLTNDFFKAFDKDKEDKLIDIVKMFENSQIISEIVEGVQERGATLTAPILPPDVTHNTPNVLTQSPSVPNVSFPNMSSSQPYPIMPSVPMPFHPPPVSSFPPLTFPPPPLVHTVMPPPPPVIPVPVVPPPVSASASMYGPFPVSLQPLEVCRMPDTKQVKKRPTTLRPINITNDIPSNSSKVLSQLSPVKSVESKEKETSEIFAEQNNTLIETFKKLKTEKHYAHMKVNSCVSDMLEMRKIMDDTWGKKVNPSDRVLYSKCKDLLSVSSNSMNYCLKEAKRLDEELNRFKGRLPKKIMDELGKIKIEPSKSSTNEYYSCYDTSNHTCYVCYKQFSNLLGILEHLHSAEHKEQMTSNDKDWAKKFKKPEQNDEGKKVILKPVEGVEFMKPFTGYFCTLCSETLLDSASAEQHLKSHDHYYKYKDYILKNPIYERKCLFKKYIKHSVFSKDKKEKEKEQRLSHLKKVEEANEKIKDTLKDQKSKEKIVEELVEDDADPLASKNQSLPGIKLTLSGDKEKDKQNVKEKSSKASATKAIQKVVYIGKAPNYKSRPKPWYKKDIYLKKEESSSKSPEPTLPTINLSNEKNSKNVRELSPSNNKPDESPKSNQSFLGDDIPETVKAKENVTKKVIESTCLTEEDSLKISTSADVIPCKEKSSTVSNDLTTCSTEGESKNLNISCDDKKNVSTIPSTKKIQPVCGDSGSILNSEASSEKSTIVQNEKDTCNRPGSPANKKKSNTMPMTEDSTVNQALKNILLGTDSSVHQDIPLSEIQLPAIPVQNSRNTQTNSMSHGESNIPIPMEIDDINDKLDFSSYPKLNTDEDRDLYILGINREDLIPLVVPVPPPSSVLNSASPSHSPSNLSPIHKPNLSDRLDTTLTATTVNKSANESKPIPVLISIHVNKAPIVKKKTLAYTENKSNVIIQTNDSLKLVSPLISHTEKIDTTSIELKNLITECGSVESSDVNTNDKTATVNIKSQDVNAESNVDITISKEDSILQISKTSLETTKTKLLEIDSILELSNQVSDECEGNENVNKVFSGASENLKEEPDTNLNLVDTVSQDKVVNEIVPATDSVIIKSDYANSDDIPISKCEPSNSSNLAEKSVESDVELSVVKDEEVFSISMKPHEVPQSSVNNMSEKISGLEPAQKSSGQNQVSNENNIPDVEVCASNNKSNSAENQPFDIKSTQDLVLGQSLNQNSNNEVTDMEVCNDVHMQDQESDFKSCQSLTIKQPLHQLPSIESVSETCVSPDILIRDEQSNSDIKSHLSSDTEQLLNQASINESTPNMEVKISDNKAVTSQQYTQSDIEVECEQSFPHKESLSDMKVCASVCDTCPENDQPSDIKPNLNLACCTDSVFPVQSSEKNDGIETVDVTNKKSVSEQTVHMDVTLFVEKEHEECITPSSTTFDSSKEIISDMKASAVISESADLNMTTPVGKLSEDILDSNLGIIPEQCLFENACSPEAVRMEIVSEQQAIFTEEKIQCDVKSAQDFNPLHTLNQSLVAENISDATESRLVQECHFSKKSSETDFLENKNCDIISTGSSELSCVNLSENISLEMDKKYLQPESLSICKKSEYEVKSSEEVIPQLSSNQCDRMSEKTALCNVNDSKPDENVHEVLIPDHISIIGKSISEQETTQLKPEIVLESTAIVEKELDKTLHECNMSTISQMDEKQQAGYETNLKSPGLEDKAGDLESETQILSSLSGEVGETQNLPKSDTDTDEYENEE